MNGVRGQFLRGLLPLSGHEVLVTHAGGVYIGEPVPDDQRRWGDLPTVLLAAYDKSVDPNRAWVRPYGVVAEEHVIEAEVGNGRAEPTDEQWWQVAVLRVGRLWACEYGPSWTWLRLTVDGVTQTHFRANRVRA